jgi:hypothetical protein
MGLIHKLVELISTVFRITLTNPAHSVSRDNYFITGNTGWLVTPDTGRYRITDTIAGALDRAATELT